MKTAIRFRKNSDDCYRLVRDGAIVAHAMLLNSGRWGVFIPGTRNRLIWATFEKPADAAAGLAANFPAAPDEGQRP